MYPGNNAIASLYRANGSEVPRHLLWPSQNEVDCRDRYENEREKQENKVMAEMSDEI